MPGKKKFFIPPPPPPPPGPHITRPTATPPTPPTTTQSHTPVISSPIITSPVKNGIDLTSLKNNEKVTEIETTTEQTTTQEAEDTVTDISSQKSDNTTNCEDLDETTQASVDSKKPKPATKPSRLKRALTSGSITLNRFSSKKKDGNKRLSVNLEETEQPSQITHPSRDGGLWQLPGMDLAAAKKQLTPPPKEKVHRSSEGQAKFDEIANKLKKELPSLPAENTPSSTHRASIEKGPDIQKRELPPLPPQDDTASQLTHPHASHISPKQSAALDNFDTYSELQPTEETSNLGESISSHASEDCSPPPLPARMYIPSGAENRSSDVAATPVDSTLHSALNTHAGCFPMRFKVLQGYCNDTTDVQMSTDDVYDIHMVKETKVYQINFYFWYSYL